METPFVQTAGLLRAIGLFLSGVCHQLPEHTLFHTGVQMPLCARCTGTYLGAMVAFLLLSRKRHSWPARLPPARLMLLLGILALCWAVDGTNSYLHYLTGRVWLYVPSNALRLATGLGFGLTLSALVWPLFHESLWRDPSNERVLSGWGDLARVVLAMVPLWAALQMDHPVLAGLIPLLDALSVTVVLGVVNSLIVLIVLGRENKAERWRETLVPLGLGLLLATGEVAAIAWLRAFLWRLLL